MSSKSAFIAITGRPNTGKSSLTNFLVGEKIAIVSEKPQTTRMRINGVLTRGETQFVFIDTPGMHKAKNKLSENMIKSINDSVDDVDAILFLTDATKPIGATEKDMINGFKTKKCDVILLINKIDLVKDKRKLLDTIQSYTSLYEFSEVIPISVKNRINTDDILPTIEKYAKESPHFFDDDLPTDQPEKVWLSEIVREKILRNMQEEIPHGVAVYVESLEYSKTTKGEDIADIGIVIVCEKSSHKGMIIGKQGAMLKRIGALARSDMEQYFGTKVNMKIWVKIKEDWRNKESAIADFGLDAQ